jgi:hypothetical protein
VLVASGRTFQADVSPRTDHERLWLAVRSGDMEMLRPIAWDRVVSARLAGRTMTGHELRGVLLGHSSLTSAIQQTPQESAAQPDAQDPFGDDPQSDPPLETLPAPQAEPQPPVTATPVLLPPGPPRVASVQFDAHLANWDGDVETDGLIVQVMPLDETGHVAAVCGNVQIELYGQRQIPFQDAPTKRGRRIERLANWNRLAVARDYYPHGAWYKLPFQADHPEFNTELGRTGLVHVRLVVPGAGVFESSIDGLRIRPFAPLRDELERVEGRRFLATELLNRP